jgi:1-acyl-sn-glycerol-3-phosphate acyltransferase
LNNIPDTCVGNVNRSLVHHKSMNKAPNTSKQYHLPHQTWVLKRELLLIPVCGWALAMLKPIIINRGEKFKAL